MDRRRRNVIFLRVPKNAVNNWAITDRDWYSIVSSLNLLNLFLLKNINSFDQIFLESIYTVRVDFCFTHFLKIFYFMFHECSWNHFTAYISVWTFKEYVIFVDILYKESKENTNTRVVDLFFIILHNEIINIYHIRICKNVLYSSKICRSITV